MTDWVDDLNERSKNDREIIVGSEVRSLCNEIFLLRKRIGVLEAAEWYSSLTTQQRDAANFYADIQSLAKENVQLRDELDEVQDKLKAAAYLIDTTRQLRVNIDAAKLKPNEYICMLDISCPTHPRRYIHTHLKNE